MQVFVCLPDCPRLWSYRSQGRCQHLGSPVWMLHSQGICHFDIIGRRLTDRGLLRSLRNFFLGIQVFRSTFCGNLGLQPLGLHLR